MRRTLPLILLLAACGGDTPPDSAAGADSASDPPTAEEEAAAPAVYVGVTLHLEGWNNTDPDVFALYARTLRERADLFERYGARMTLETKELTDGILLWGDNVLLELQDRGHSVGLHADLGEGDHYRPLQMIVTGSQSRSYGAKC